jgi:hypothetical protein
MDCYSITQHLLTGQVEAKESYHHLIDSLRNLAMLHLSEPNALLVQISTNTIKMKQS